MDGNVNSYVRCSIDDKYIITLDILYDTSNNDDDNRYCY